MNFLCCPKRFLISTPRTAIIRVKVILHFFIEKYFKLNIEYTIKTLRKENSTVEPRF